MSIIRYSPINHMLSQWPDMWDDDLLTSVSGTNRDLDVYETQDEVVVRANVAGTKEKDVDITFEKGVLWIKAERKEEVKNDRKHYHKSSWSYSYKISVPGLIDFSIEPKAEIEDGVITISFKKSEASKPKKLIVTARAK